MQFSPQAFGKYFLVDKIATGGMAEIFKAKTYGHGGFEHLLVIKRILSHLGENEDFVEMFIDEAKVSVALQHPNIVRIYDFGKILENYFIAMECVEGKDARNLLRKLAQLRRLMPIDYGVYVAYEACKGLAYAHAKKDLHGDPYGIVHRDISPSNVIVSYDGHVKVADFGIAKAESNAYQTRDGVLKGKYEYMSPEQAQGEELDPRSDVFSLGIILHEMLTGRRLFKAQSELKTLEQIKAADVPPPSEKNGRIPPDLDKIVLKALAKNREDRYQTAEALAQDLRGFLRGSPDAYSEELATFMADVFKEEIAAERERLKTGSEIAAQLREQLPADNWDATTESTMGRPLTTQVEARRSIWPLFIAGAVFLLLPSVGIGVVGILAAQNLIAEPSPAPATTGSLDIMVLPEATITVNGVNRGKHGVLRVDNLAAGEHSLTLDAEGYEPVNTTVIVVPGKEAMVQRTLSPVAKEIDPPEETTRPSGQPARPAPAPVPTTGPPVVVFSSTPAGATVLVDGKVVGTTPLRWTDGAPGTSYKVTLAKPGYSAVNGTVRGLSNGRKSSFSRVLEGSNEPGTLKVVLSGGGWAHVYINGKKQKKTAPLSVDLPAGSYTVRVVNEATGLDTTQTITVHPGEKTAVQASP